MLSSLVLLLEDGIAEKRQNFVNAGRVNDTSVNAVSLFFSGRNSVSEW